MEEKKFYQCYSLNLLDYLKGLGFKYEFKAVNQVSGRTFWVFYRSDELKKALAEWTLRGL